MDEVTDSILQRLGGGFSFDNVVRQLIEPLRGLTKEDLLRRLEEAQRNLELQQKQGIDALLDILSKEITEKGIRLDEMLVISSFYPLPPLLNEALRMLTWEDLSFGVRGYQQEAFANARLKPRKDQNNFFIFVSDIAQSLHLDPYDVEKAFERLVRVGLLNSHRRGNYSMEDSIRRHLQSVALNRLSESIMGYLYARAQPLKDYIEVAALNGIFGCGIKFDKK